jgi:hypothetical protein
VIKKDVIEVFCWLIVLLFHPETEDIYRLCFCGLGKNITFELFWCQVGKKGIKEANDAVCADENAL